MVEIPQPDGTIKRFPQSQLAEAYLVALDRACGATEDDHPLCRAARNSSDPEWRNSVYWADLSDRPAEDLSEP
jgi:hypothetical protein